MKSLPLWMMGLIFISWTTATNAATTCHGPTTYQLVDGVMVIEVRGCVDDASVDPEEPVFVYTCQKFYTGLDGFKPCGAKGKSTDLLNYCTKPGGVGPIGESGGCWEDGFPKAGLDMGKNGQVVEDGIIPPKNKDYITPTDPPIEPPIVVVPPVEPPIEPPVIPEPVEPPADHPAYVAWDHEQGPYTVEYTLDSSKITGSTTEHYYALDESFTQFRVKAEGGPWSEVFN